MVIFLAIGVLIAGRATNWSPAITLWSFTCIGIGSLLGFLFGIPSRVSRPDRTVHEAREGTALEQVSQWLTRIIIGGSLLQIGDMRDALSSWAAYVSPENPSLAMAIILYFTIYGFVTGYLITRIELSEKL